MNKEQTKPTPDQVREWAKQDLLAAIHFLNMLMGLPEVLDIIADRIVTQAEMYEKHKAKQEELNTEEVK